MGKRIGEYKGGEISFITLAKELGEKTFDYMKQATVGVVIDTIVCDVVTDTSYICMLLCQAHDAFTHQLFSEDDGSLSTELVPHKAVLPMPHKNCEPLWLLIHRIYPFASLNQKVNMTVKFVIF